MIYKNYIKRYAAFVMSFIFVFFGFIVSCDAKRLEDYNEHISKGLSYRFSYRKNDDGKDTVTLIKCGPGFFREDGHGISMPSSITVGSYVDWYNITQVEDNFNEVRLWGRRSFLSKSEIIAFLLIPVVGWLIAGISFDRYYEEHIRVDVKKIRLSKCQKIGKWSFKESKSLKKLNLPVCVSLGESAFEGCSSLERVNMPKCLEIGNNAFSGCQLKQLCVSKNIDLSLGYVRALFQGILDAGGVLKCADEMGNVKRVHSIEEFNNFGKEKENQNQEQSHEPFDAIDPETGVRVYADPGVFPKSVHLVVKKIDKGEGLSEEYKDYLKNLDEEYRKQVEKLEFYDIKVVDEKSGVIQPNGKVTIQIPLKEGMDEKDLKSLLVLESKDSDFENKVVEIDGEKYCSFDVDHFSIYCLVDIFSVRDIFELLLPYAATITALSLVAWGIFSALRKRKLHIN